MNSFLSRLSRFRIPKLVVGFLVFVFIFRATPAHASTTTDYCMEPVEAEFFSLINDYRTANGLPTFKLSWNLSAAAQHHSLDMYTTRTLSHTLSDGTDWYANIRNHGYTYAYLTENIAWGYSTAQQVFNAWKGSPTHNEHMLSSLLNAIGIDRSGGVYWTTTFGGTPDGNPPPLCPQPTLTSVPVSATAAPTPQPTTTMRDVTPPAVSITSPTNGATVTRRASVNITASASDNVGIQRVDFYIGGKRKCSDASAPYSCLWSVPNKPNASYTLKATAIDTSGNTTSSSVTVTAQ